MLGAVEYISVIGCGGIGSWLLPPLLRFLNAVKFGGYISLWDGDRYTRDNTGRQAFESIYIGVNKAEAQSRMFCDYALHFNVCSEYVDKSNLASAVPEKALVITCVDNHPLRVLVDRRAVQLRDSCVLSVGNEKLDGNVHVFLRRAGKNITQPLLERHPELAGARRGDRADLGCEVLVAKGETQLLVTNFLAAAAAFNAFHLLWFYGERLGGRRRAPPQELYFDAGQGSMTLIPAQAERS